METSNRFSDDEIQKIIASGMVYVCDCPGQTALQVSFLRDLIGYENKCRAASDNNHETHDMILTAASAAHALMEDCLENVLVLEKWNRQTLEMPAGMRKKKPAQKTDFI